MPHPSEAKVNVRLQTTGQPATAVFKAGLETLVEVATHIGRVFDAAVEAGPGVTAGDAAADADAPMADAAVEPGRAGAAGAGADTRRK